MPSRLKSRLLFIVAIIGFLFTLCLPSYSGASNYFYDEGNRLIRVENDNGSIKEYTYDASGNRIQQSDYTSAYTMTATAGSNGSISPSGTIKVPPGSNQTYTITPDTGYAISDLLVDSAPVVAVPSYTFTNVAANHTISASFVRVYTITATAGSNGSITPAGAISVVHNTSQTYTIMPASGFAVADVLVDGVSVGNVTSYTFSDVTVAHSISASFVYSVDPCTGGTATIDGAYTVRTFTATASGTLTCLANLPVEVLVVAGGGGGGVAGGGGGGGLVYNASMAVTAATSYPVTVGVGGTAGTPSVQGGNGSNSVFSSITAIGGGGGGKSDTAGSAGGSGGGGGTNSGGGQVYAGGSGTSGQGYAGGSTPGYDCSPCGGGGGAGGAGSGVSPFVGGVGLAYSISGTSVYYAGGGGGGAYCGSYGAAGGLGGGGTGTVWTKAGDGTSNTGGGGGGGNPGGSGGSGIVIVRYLTSGMTYTITATVGSNGSITPSGATTVVSGASQTYTITPDSGYIISDVLVDGTSVGVVTSYTFSSITANHTISASFVLGSTITATAGINGSITPSGAINVAYGLSQTYTITPASGSLVSDVLVDGVSVGAVTSYTFSSVTANHTISASFVYFADPCTGGTATIDGTYTVRTFTASGTFSCTSAVTAQYLVVAGGGGGGDTGGGGGAGGFISGEDSLSTGNYSIVIGAGGSGSTDWGQAAGAGSNSSFNSHAAVGGGRGGTFLGSEAGNGGSGGGGDCQSPSPKGTGTSVQGYDGGTGATSIDGARSGGGGGGVSTVGGNGGDNVNAGVGGDGKEWPTGSGNYYAGGGGGGSVGLVGGNGGVGGGGNGGTGNNAGAAGIANTGGGGGGGGYTSMHNAGGSGGSGIVIVRYLTPSVTYTITATAGSNGSITPSGAVSVNAGTSQTYTITPATGYQVADILVDGVSVGAVTSYTLSNIVANHIISVSFAASAFTLTVLNNTSEPLTGIKCYAFTEAGTYLSLSGTTNSVGQVTFNLADGNYKFRVDYLGYQFWTDVVTVPTTMSLTKTIAHQNVNVTVEGSLAGNVELKSSIPVYLFTSSGSYLSINKTTDSSGRVTFNLPQQAYKVRADYLGQQFWSDLFTWTDKTIVIPEGTAHIHVTGTGLDLSNVPVYVFSGGGSYLSINGTTDTSGIKEFRLPAGSYKFRADYQGNQYWATATISQDVVNTVELSTGGGKFTLTVDTGSGPLTGVNVYLFNSTGSYLSVNATSDTAGQVTFNLADGSYKFRVDYLGYQFWTDVVTVPTTMSLTKTIAHQNINVTVEGSLAGNVELKSSIPVYLFTSSGSYLSINKTTDSSGRVTFNLPQQAYKMRADYLSQQFWSEEFTWTDKTIVIPEGTAHIHVTGAGLDLSNVPVYVFSGGGSYLSINGTTDTSGIKDFRLPAGSYKFRADYQGNQYWATATISQDVVNTVELSTGGGKFTLTVDTGSGPLTGVNVYLFNSTGSYLSVNATSDTAGQVTFNLADGSYKFRVDYLGYQFWTDVYTVPTSLSGNFSIPHQNTMITIEGVYQGSQPLAGVKVYLFAPSGSYLSVNQTTNDSGQVTFNLPNKSYKVRADYLGSQFWSDEFQFTNAAVNIQRGIAQITAKKAGNPMAGLKVYLFSEAGTYLGLSATTNTEGIAEFLIPNLSYKFRVDQGSTQYWSAVTTITAGQVNSIEVDWN